MAYSRELLAATGIAVAPGVDFDTRDGGSFIRFSFAGATDGIHEALDRLGRHLG
jgi:aspartate/methionine/tyrosine aminotransferase